MFSKCIVASPLANTAANSMFPNIGAQHYMGDESLSSTLRVLLHERASAGHAGAWVSTSSFSERLMGRVRNNDFFANTVDPDCMSAGSLQIHYPTGSGSNLVFERFDSDFCKTFSGFRRLPDLEAFASKYMNARFYINEEGRKSIVLVESLSIRKYHFLQVLIPRLFPWYFEDKPVTEDEKKFLSTLTERNALSYEQALTEYAEKFDIRNKTIEIMLGNFETANRESQLRGLRDELLDNQSRIDRNLLNYKNLIEARNDMNLRIAGLEALIRSGVQNTDLVEYFRCNKNLILIGTNDRGFSFVVKTYLDSFDPEMYETMAQNEHSHLYHGYDYPSKFEKQEDRKLLLDAIFSEEPLLKVKVCAYYRLDTQGYVDSCEAYSYPTECSGWIPNPHLQYYNCLGDHRRYIQESISSGDMVRAVEQCVASAKSINIGESPTVTRFLADFLRSTNKIIELPDGTSVTPDEAFDWLKKNKEVSNA